MYSEHKLIVLCRVTDTAIASRFVFKFTWLWGSILFTMIDVPPDALLVCLFIWLYIVCCLIFNLSFSFKKVSWRHITHGRKFLMMSVNWSKLAFVPLMFHYMILFILQVCFGPIVFLVGRCFVSHVWFVDWLWLVVLFGLHFLYGKFYLKVCSVSVRDVVQVCVFGLLKVNSLLRFWGLVGFLFIFCAERWFLFFFLEVA